MQRRILALVACWACAVRLVPLARAQDPVPAPGPAPDAAPAPAAEREASLARAADLDRRVAELVTRAKYADAEPLARESLLLRERAWGKDHLEVAASVARLADVLSGQGAFGAARPLLERALSIREQALDKDHPDVATALDALGALLQDLGLDAAAEPLVARALGIRERALGPDHADLAPCLDSLAGILYRRGAYADARARVERGLTIREKAMGPDHLAVAASLNNLALILEAEGRLADATRRIERSLSIRERVLGPDHPDVAQSLHNLAGNLAARGLPEQARRSYERSIATKERTLGRDHPSVAKSLRGLARVLRAEAQYSGAAALLDRALAVQQRALGPNHPEVAETLLDLARLRAEQGLLAEARERSERALSTYERALGKHHPAVAECLYDLAGLLARQGSYAEAKPLSERALSIRENALPSGHPAVAASLHGLGTIEWWLGAHAEAKRHLEHALAIWERRFGADAPLVATAIEGLAVLQHGLGAHAEARALLERALAIREARKDVDDRALADVLHNLLLVAQAQGHLDEALRLGERALAIREGRPGDLARLAETLNALAGVLGAQGAAVEASRLLERALRVDSERARTELAGLSASQRLALVRSVRHRLDHWVQSAPSAGRSGHPEVLRARGLVTRAESAERAMARRTTGAPRATFVALQDATRLASRLANEVPPPFDAEVRADWQARYAGAAAARERAVRELASEVASARSSLERLDLTESDVRGALAPDTTLVDLLRAGDHYVGWVLGKSRETARVELGTADTIDAACEAFVAAVADDAGDGTSHAAVEKAGAALRALVWAPLAARLGEGVRRVVVCPDAALATVPFAALPGDAPGTWLGDQVSISFVFHPFDLVPRKDPSASGVGALVVGGVDYDRADVGSKEAPLPELPPVLASLDRAPRGGSYAPIPATKAEAEALRDRFGEDATTLLLGAHATEARVREGVKGKRFAHVATHGFARTDLLAGLHDRKIRDAFLSADAERQLSGGHDPMLLSGLALAGANPRDGAGGDDGVLTALEASYLDLDGVDVVTLSACETARGTAESGEGVLGLVSAFQMAGARDVLASLWKVDDEATRLLMEGVYERMLRKEHPLTPADALREAASALRVTRDPATGRARFASPRYWAAFVAYGG